MRALLAAAVVSAFLGTASGQGAASDKVDVVDTNAEKQAFADFQTVQETLLQKAQLEFDLVVAARSGEAISTPAILALEAVLNAELVNEILTDPVALDPNRNVSFVTAPDQVFALADLLGAADVAQVFAEAR